MTVELIIQSLRKVCFNKTIYSLVELKKLENTVKIGNKTNKVTAKEKTYQKFIFEKELKELKLKFFKNIF